MVETLIWTKPFQYKFLPENKNSSLLPTCAHATHKLSYKYLLSHSSFYQISMHINERHDFCKNAN